MTIPTSYFNPYEFTVDQDWFSSRIPQFEQFLKHLDGAPCALLEIGCHEGRASFWLADNVLGHKSSMLACVDPYEAPEPWNGKRRWWSNYELCPRRNRIFQYEMYSADALMNAMMPGFDFAYIDGLHFAHDVMTDWCLVRQLMKPGGIVCFDDYEWTDDANVKYPPKCAIDLILALWEDEVTILYRGWQIWLRVTK